MEAVRLEMLKRAGIYCRYMTSDLHNHFQYLHRDVAQYVPSRQQNIHALFSSAVMVPHAWCGASTKRGNRSSIGVEAMLQFPGKSSL